MSKSLHIVILAAGEGSRMQSSLPKVLQTMGGRPMLTHLLETAAALDPEQVHVVIGSGADLVKEACDGFDVNLVIQAQRQGTGHAGRGMLITPVSFRSCRSLRRRVFPGPAHGSASAATASQQPAITRSNDLVKVANVIPSMRTAPLQECASIVAGLTA